METVNLCNSDKICYLTCLRYARICGMMLVISIIATLCVESIDEYKIEKVMKDITAPIGLVSFLGALLLYLCAVFCYIIKKIGFKFIFYNKYVFVAGGNSQGIISREKIYYSEIAKIYLDIGSTLFLCTSSERTLAEISLGNEKDKIKQILKEFQKRGKSVKIAPELYGIYMEENGYVS